MFISTLLIRIRQFLIDFQNHFSITFVNNLIWDVRFERNNKNKIRHPKPDVFGPVPKLQISYLGFSRMRRFSTRYHNISSNESNSLLKKVVFLQFRKGHTYSAHVAMGGGGPLKCVYSKSKGTYLITMMCRGTMDRIFKKRGYERDEFLFRTVIKIRKIQFT